VLYYEDLRHKGFSLRSSSFLVPLVSNNILVSGEEAVSFLPSSPLFARERSSHSVPPVKAGASTKKETNEEVLVVETKPTLVEQVPEVKPKTVDPKDYPSMSDEELVELVDQGKLQAYRLEQDLKDCARAVKIRRMLLRT
jgi:hydroxymethylglutaryl-CoA reductase (NADPH)